MASCQYCYNLEKYKYWHEFPPTLHKFFKVMVGDFEYQMRIPDKFVENFQGKISTCCILRGPSNNEWNVKVRRAHEGATFFTDGWMNFVMDHGIKNRNLLLFCYAGKSTFNVFIFDDTACEVESSHFMKPSSLSTHMTCRSVLHDQEMRDASGDEGNENFSHHTRPTTSRVKQRQVYYVSNRRHVTQYEMQKARDMATDFLITNEPSGLPMINITMLPTHVYSGFHLTIPKDWALKHMYLEDHNVELRVPGVMGRWVVGCRWTASMQCHFIPNWPRFVLENNLEEHDVCVFVLAEKMARTSTNIPLFYVHIFRVVKELVPVTVKRRGK